MKEKNEFVRNNIKLSARLMMSINMTEPCRTVADVGCDHAHTCIWLIKNQRAGHCIGMDVRTGPLGKATENISLYGCENEIELRLSYGLDELKKGEADTVIIAGMGGELVKDILERDGQHSGIVHLKNNGEEPRNSARPVLILQPQSHIYEVREYLEELGYVIDDEDMCEEDGKYYVSVRAVPAESLKRVQAHSLSEAEKYFGPVLLAKRHPILKEFLEIEYRKKKHMLEQIGRSETPEAAQRMDEVKHLFEVIAATRMEGGD